MTPPASVQSLIWLHQGSDPPSCITTNNNEVAFPSRYSFQLNDDLPGVTRCGGRLRATLRDFRAFVVSLWAGDPRAYGAAAPSGSQTAMWPARAEAAVVNGLARYSCPGPDRPGKFRLIALTVTVFLS